MKSDLKSIRARFVRAHRALGEARDAKLNCSLRRPERAFNAVVSHDGTDARLYAKALKLKQSHAYSPRSATSAVALAYLRRLHRLGYKWDTLLAQCAPEWK